MDFITNDYQDRYYEFGRMSLNKYTIKDVLSCFLEKYPDASIYYEDDYEAEEDDLVVYWDCEGLSGETHEGLFFGIETGE